MRLRHAFILGVLVCSHSVMGQSAVVVRINPAVIDVQAGETFSLDLIADLDPHKVIGWGLDLGSDNAMLTQIGLPAIGSLWMPSFSPDGDGLTGYSQLASTGGAGVLLARLTYQAVGVGSTQVVPSYTPADLNEGFPLDPIGYASVVFQPGTVNVLPEPAACVLMGLASSLVMLRRHRPSTARPS